MSIIMLAPAPSQTIVAASGRAYVADRYGIIPAVQSVADQASLQAAGCLTLGVQGNFLGALLGADFNSTADQEITLSYLTQAAKFRVTKITVLNTSVNGMSTAAGGVYPAASKGGTALVANTQVYTGLTNAATALDLTLAVPNAVKAAETPLFLSLTTGQGAAATADLFVFGDLYP